MEQTLTHTHRHKNSHCLNRTILVKFWTLMMVGRSVSDVHVIDRSRTSDFYYHLASSTLYHLVEMGSKQ